MSSTLATKFGRLLISTLPPVVLLTMLLTVTDGQAIDKERSVKPQAKDISVKPTQAKANARSLSAGDASSQKMIRTGDTVEIEATSGSYRLDWGSIKTPSGGPLSLRIKRVPELRCPELRSTDGRAISTHPAAISESARGH
jgi:hypothetical protein